MLIKVQKEKKIETLEDLRFKRQQLATKADKKAKKITKKVQKLSSKTTAPIVYDEILSQFNLQHSLMNMLPMVLKYKEQIGNIGLVNAIKKSPKKRIALITLGAMSAGLLAYFSLSKKSVSKEQKSERDISRKEPVERDQLFV